MSRRRRPVCQRRSTSVRAIVDRSVMADQRLAAGTDRSRPTADQIAEGGVGTPSMSCRDRDDGRLPAQPLAIAQQRLLIGENGVDEAETTSG